MSATKSEALNLALQKSMEGFTAIIDRPMDTYIINIPKLLLHVLIDTKYDDPTLMHNLSWVILPTYRYKHIYSKVAYSILTIITL